MKPIVALSFTLCLAFGCTEESGSGDTEGEVAATDGSASEMPSGSTPGTASNTAASNTVTGDASESTAPTTPPTMPEPEPVPSDSMQGSGGAPSMGEAGSGGSPEPSGGAAGEANQGGAPSGAGGDGGVGGGASGAGTGGALGGAPNGGVGGDGAAAGDGGAAGSENPPDELSMSFFVTSRGMGDGGNLGGLEGADAFCAMLATEADPNLASKTWRAYLSTDEVDAITRIGSGPWRNAELVVIANGLEDLHAQEEGEALDDTWPPMDESIALDENGDSLANDVHDVLTGTLVDGSVAEGAHCQNWTLNDSGETAQVGHSNRSGGGRPPYFNATHEVGCAEGSENYESGAVTQGGGRGSIYCFAAD